MQVPLPLSTREYGQGRGPTPSFFPTAPRGAPKHSGGVGGRTHHPALTEGPGPGSPSACLLWVFLAAAQVAPAPSPGVCAQLSPVSRPCALPARLGGGDRGSPTSASPEQEAAAAQTAAPNVGGKFRTKQGDAWRIRFKPKRHTQAMCCPDSRSGTKILTQFPSTRVQASWKSSLMPRFPGTLSCQGMPARSDRLSRPQARRRPRRQGTQDTCADTPSQAPRALGPGHRAQGLAGPGSERGSGCPS